MAKRIDGKAIAAQIKQELKEQVQQLAKDNITVTLAVIQVGQDPASCVYVRNKQRTCEELGIHSLSYELEETTSEEKLLSLIQELNAREDVDGFHPYNVGALSCGEEGFVPGTPAGIIELLKRSDIRIDGKECVVIGRSNIVGKPIAQLLLAENGTVTIAHSHTVNLKEVTKRADILVVAVGKRQMIDAEYVKPGATVIDVGIHRDEANHLCGDVDYESVFPVASAITPVPGGVGPMTIAMLMKNCIESRRRRL